jgi:arylsulfatase A-like enzyme
MNRSMTSQPNILFIVADDLGWADLGCYGGRSDCSPVLDNMAREGLRFTDGYANSALCSPSRFALITGRYQYRLRGAAEEPLTGRTHDRADIGLPPAHPTLPSVLRDGGYRTALFGKWHLGYPPHFGPRQSGYQEFFGLLGGGVDYFTHRDRAGHHDLFENETPVSVKGYLTDVITDRALAFIRSASAGRKPFFASVHYTAPHWPWETRDDEALAQKITDIAHTDGGSIEIYQAMIRQMDEGIGRLLTTLRQCGADSNTLIVFTSDNGGERFSDTWPLVGKKMDLLEGGIRVPLLARWPDGIEPNRSTLQVAVSMDWMPTMLAAAGLAADSMYPADGISLLPILRDDAPPAARDLFWRMKHRDQRAVRSGRWKYLSLDCDEFLFDLETDLRERANMAMRHPDILQRLKGAYLQWAATMPPIPDDAVVSHAYTRATLAAPSG